MQNSDLILETAPLIQIQEHIKKESVKNTVPFGSPNINLTKDRSPGAIIS